MNDFQKNIAATDVVKESYHFKRLWRELQTLDLSSDKILQRKGDKNKQSILTSRLRPLVFKKLDIDIGHLGYDRTLELNKIAFLLALIV